MRVIGRRALAASLVVALCGCTTWHLKTGVTPQEVLAQKQWKALRLTTTDGHRQIVRAPRLAGDTVLGTSGDTAVAIPVSRIAYAELPGSDASSLLLGGLLLTGIWAFLFWVTHVPQS